MSSWLTIFIKLYHVKWPRVTTQHLLKFFSQLTKISATVWKLKTWSTCMCHRSTLKTLDLYKVHWYHCDATDCSRQLQNRRNFNNWTCSSPRRYCWIYLNESLSASFFGFAFSSAKTFLLVGSGSYKLPLGSWSGRIVSVNLCTFSMSIPLCKAFLPCFAISKIILYTFIGWTRLRQLNLSNVSKNSSSVYISWLK